MIVFVCILNPTVKILNTHTFYYDIHCKSTYDAILHYWYIIVASLSEGIH